MRHKMLSLFAAVALMASLTFPTSAPAAQQPTGGPGTAAGKQAQGEKGERGEKGEKGEKGEREEHPALREALHHLHAAKEILEKKAAHDFHGHRVQAIQSIDQAIEHLEQALKSDTK